MATKKQKREAAETKRVAFEAQLKADGLKAQEIDRQQRRLREERLRDEVREREALVEETLRRIHNSNLKRMAI